MMPRVGEKYWERYRQLISTDELRNRLVVVYDKHYSSEELNEMLKFYDSPLGKKMSDAAIPVLRDSMDVAQELAKRAAQSVVAVFSRNSCCGTRAVPVRWDLPFPPVFRLIPLRQRQPLLLPRRNFTATAGAGVSLPRLSTACVAALRNDRHRCL